MKSLIFKNIFKKIKLLIIKTPWFFANYFFGVLILVCLILGLVGFLLFKNYVILTREEKVSLGPSSSKFREDIYSEILRKIEIEEGEVQLKEKEYSNPFEVIKNLK